MSSIYNVVAKILIQITRNYIKKHFFFLFRTLSSYVAAKIYVNLNFNDANNRRFTAFAVAWK